MAVPQQKIREIVFQLLYSYDLAQPSDEDMVALMAKELSVSKKTVYEAGAKMHAVISRLDEIDKKIEETARSYDFSRIQCVEKNILRLAVYELCYDEEIPPKVAIAEAMRLAKKFSTAEAATFVNAIIDAIYKKQEGDTVDDTEVVESFDAMIHNEEISNEASKSEDRNAIEFPDE